MELSVGSLKPSFPVWSPDGARIAFRGVGRTGAPSAATAGVYVVDVDGTGLHMAIPTGVDTRYWSAASWSPDGRWLVVDVVDPQDAARRDIAVAPIGRDRSQRHRGRPAR